MLADLDVTIEPDLALGPFGMLVGLGGQRLQRRPVERLERLPPARTQVPGHLAAERLEQLPDRGVQLGEREALPFPQPGDDPALHELDADLDLGLVARPEGARRQDRGVGVRDEIGAGPVDLRLVE